MQTKKYNLCHAQLGRDTLRVKCPIIQKINPGSHADADHRIDMSEVVNVLEREFGIDEHKNTAG
jgi:hypothetical protein